jgi:hypothetical protein
MNDYTFWEENKDEVRAILICNGINDTTEYTKGDSGKILEWIKGDAVKIQLSQGTVWVCEWQFKVV